MEQGEELEAQPALRRRRTLHPESSTNGAQGVAGPDHTRMLEYGVRQCSWPTIISSPRTE